MKQHLPSLIVLVIISIMHKPFKIGLIQMHMSEDKKENLARALSMLEKAAARGAQVACLPELFLTPYFCKSEDHDIFALAEPIDGPTGQAIAKLAKKTKMAIVSSVFERRTKGLYHNTAVVYDADGETLGIYRKMHIPDDPLYYEKFYFTPGDLGYKTFQTRYGKVGTLVCWDQWFPEAARLTAMQGADVIFYPTAIGWHPSEKKQYGEIQTNAWLSVQRGHAVANGVYIAAANRVGLEGKKGAQIEFFGHSFIYGPSGETIQQADSKKETVLIAEVSPQKVETVRQHWPFFRDRRIDSYGKLLHHPHG